MLRPAPTTPESVLALLDRLIRDGVRVSLEQRDCRWRLRYRDAGGNGGSRKRRSVELPDDALLIAGAQERVDATRRLDDRGPRTKRIREARRAILGLREKVLAASGRGRDMKKRIRWMFNLAATMGPAMLEDFLGRSPWATRGRPAGRPRKMPAV